MQWYFCFFVISGFCSILYEIVWLRISMAQFGVTTAMVSLVLSAFMVGLGAGSWAAGHITRKFGHIAVFRACWLRDTSGAGSVFAGESGARWHWLRNQYRGLRSGAFACGICAAAGRGGTGFVVPSGAALVRRSVQVLTSTEHFFWSSHAFCVFSGLMRADTGLGGSGVYQSGI